MSDDDRSEIDEDVVDRLVRGARGESHRPAPDAGAEQIAVTARPRRATRNAVLGGLAMAAVIGVGAVIVLARRSGDSVHTTPSIPTGASTLPTPTEPHTTASTAPSTTAATSTMPTTSLPSTFATPTTAPPRTWERVAALVDVPWESARIPRACGEVWWEQQQTTQTRCTELAIDPGGVPITYEPATRVVTRHTRFGGPVSFELPEEYVDPNLIAAGPDGLAYFALDNEWPTPSDVLAISVAPGDPGTVFERFPEALDIGDADLFVTETGLVLSGRHEEGARPAHDSTPFVRWVRRDGREPTDGGTFSPAQFDDASGIVNASGWQWMLDDRLIDPGQTGTGRVVSTYDRGFLALSMEHTGDLRAEVIRGHRDGTVEHWLFPGSWFDLGTPILEPQGTILVPNGDTFVRVNPFAPRSNGWDGALEVDPATGRAEAIGLNDFIDSYIASLDQSGDGTLPWKLGPVAFADAVAGPLGSPAEIRTITWEDTGDGGYRVAVTTEGHPDDSIFGTRLDVQIVFDEWHRVGTIEWSQTCRPGRGHQDYQAALCI